MNEGRISGRYSRALFLIAKEKGVIDSIRNDMKLILELSALEDVREMLSSPVIENRMKRDALSSILSGKVHELTMNLVMLTVENNRESFLQGIARAYIELADRHNGITKVTLTTAVSAGGEVTRAVSELIEKGYKTKVDLNEVVDESITGGFMLKVEDTLIDGSVRTQLKKIEKELKERV